MTSEIKRKGRHRMSANATALSEMVSLLGRGQYTKEELADKVGVTIHTIIKWINIGRRRNRRLYYIFAYRRGPVGQPAALWAYGPDELDAKRPPPMTQREYNERSRIKKVLRARGTLAGMAQTLKQAASDDEFSTK